MASYTVDDLRDLLTSSAGVTTTIYRESMAPSPDDAILIRETGGFPPVRAMRSSTRAGGLGGGLTVFERRTVQITRRSPSAQRAMAEMEYIYNFLDGRSRTINGTRYALITAMQSPFPLPQDENGRAQRVVNILCEKEPSTSTST